MISNRLYTLTFVVFLFLLTFFNFVWYKPSISVDSNRIVINKYVLVYNYYKYLLSNGQKPLPLRLSVVTKQPRQETMDFWRPINAQGGVLSGCLSDSELNESKFYINPDKQLDEAGQLDVQNDLFYCVWSLVERSGDTKETEKIQLEVRQFLSNNEVRFLNIN